MSMSTFTKVSFIGLAGVAFSSLSMTQPDSAQAAGFSTPYAPTDFNLSTTGSLGSSNVDGSGAPNSITINVIAGGPGTLDYLTTAAASGPVTFNWIYASSSISDQHSFGYVLNGAFTQLTNNSGDPIIQSGSASFNVLTGQSFGFGVRNTSTANLAQAKISNFNGPTGGATVVPTPALLPGLTGMGVAAWRKRKAEAMAEISEEA